MNIVRLFEDSNSMLRSIWMCGVIAALSLCSPERDKGISAASRFCSRWIEQCGKKKELMPLSLQSRWDQRLQSARRRGAEGVCPQKRCVV